MLVQVATGAYMSQSAAIPGNRYRIYMLQLRGAKLEAPTLLRSTGCDPRAKHEGIQLPTHVSIPDDARLKGRSRVLVLERPNLAEDHIFISLKLLNKFFTVPNK
jgi:hypothetical protein